MWNERRTFSSVAFCHSYAFKYHHAYRQAIGLLFKNVKIIHFDQFLQESSLLNSLAFPSRWQKRVLFYGLKFNLTHEKSLESKASLRLRLFGMMTVHASV